jgi:predicted metal-dependent peptidase
METKEQALSKAKIRLMARPDSAFFTTLCFSLKHLWDNNVPTAGANMMTQTVRWNPRFFMSLNPEEQVFLMLHESLHIAYMHMLRKGGREHKLFNIAADHVINLQLMERGFVMPSGKNRGHADIKFKGMSAEQVYDILLKEQPNPPPDFESDIEGEGGDGNAPPMTDAAKREIEDILVRASIQSRLSQDKPGTIPGEIQLFLDKLIDPKLPWDRVLARFLTNFSKDDYSMRKPNRRFLPRYYMPTLWSESLMDLEMWFDMSASVSDDDAKAFAGGLARVMKQFKPKKIALGQFDTQVKSLDIVTNMADLHRVKFHGRGGTDIGPVLHQIIGRKPQCALIFTDGEFNWPKMAYPKTPVIWLIHNNPTFVAPFGKVIHYTL